MKKQESFLDKFDVIVKLKFVVLLLLALALLLVLAALDKKDESLPPRRIDVDNLYSLSLPSRLNYGQVGNAMVVFSGEFSNPDAMVIVNPEEEPNGEFLPLDRNPANIREMLRQCLSIANIFPKELEIGNISLFEYTMRPALEFTFRYDNYVGLGYLFMLREYSFTVACLQPQGRETSTPRRFFHRLAFMQIGKDFRPLRHSRAVVDSTQADYSPDEIIEGRSLLQAAHRFYENRHYSPENLVRSLQLFEKAFRIYAEEDEAILLEKRDRDIFYAGLDERDKYFNVLHSEIRQAQAIGDAAKERKLLKAMQNHAILDSEAEWREWAQARLNRLDAGK